jgi:thiamine kinase-like enzyme
MKIKKSYIAHYENKEVEIIKWTEIPMWIFWYDHCKLCERMFDDSLDYPDSESNSIIVAMDEEKEIHSFCKECFERNNK